MDWRRCWRRSTRASAGFVVIPMYAGAGELAIRVLLRAGKGNRAPLQLLPGLMLNDRTGDQRPRPRISAPRLGLALPER